ncbi:MAG: rhomboid family intramembrane serine protease [Thermodesulfovibrionales bacterium]|nr:rhomboid family intramembrane serine protease [Thermodesulfovibrionales bacterium]
MIPFKDDNPTRTFPFITITIIVLNCLIYLYEIFSPPRKIPFASLFGVIPYSIITFDQIQPIHPVLSIFTSMFLHGGLFHLGGNMLYLWIFGNNIEDAIGHFRFLIFYLFAGIIAAYSQAITNPSSMIPMIGASGAVSGVLGAYLLLYPHARVYTLFIFFFFVQIIRVPAYIVIGFWVIIQIVNGLISTTFAAHGGVAWFAHIGGFVAGLLTIRLWLPKRRYYYW